MIGRIGLRSTFLLSVLLVSIVFTACGGSADTPGNNAETPNAGTAETDAEASPTGAEGTANASTFEGPIVFADQTWDSAIFHNRVAQYILKHGYGYESETITGGTIPLLQGLTRGDIHVSMELWAQSTPEVLAAIERGDLIDLGDNYSNSLQGWFVPTYVIEGDPERGIEPMAPDLKSVEDLPKYKELFKDPEDPDKGRLYNCITGWICADINDAKMKAYGLTDAYTSFEPGSEAALNVSIAKAFQDGEAWLGYYWAPSWIYAKYDLTQLEEPEYTEECWDQIKSGEQACDFPNVPVKIGANPEFVEQAPDVVAFLKKYETTMEDTSEVLLYMQENEATPDEAAIWFLKNYEDTWTQWVPEDAAAKVKDALAKEQ